jgi:hypothetical protein
MHAAISSFMSDAEVMSESKGPSRSAAPKRKARFGFRASLSEEGLANLQTMMSRPVLNRKHATAESTRSNQLLQPNAIAGRFSVCDRRSSRG